MNTVFFYIIFAIEMTNLLDKPSEHHTELFLRLSYSSITVSTALYI